MVNARLHSIKIIKTADEHVKITTLHFIFSPLKMEEGSKSDLCYCLGSKYLWSLSRLFKAEIQKAHIIRLRFAMGSEFNLSAGHIIFPQPIKGRRIIYTLSSTPGTTSLVKSNDFLLCIAAIEQIGSFELGLWLEFQRQRTVLVWILRNRFRVSLDMTRLILSIYSPQAFALAREEIVH